MGVKITGNCRSSLAERHMGVIVKVAYRFWRFLPPHMVIFIDLEELVAESVYQVTRQSSKYNPALAGESTFVWRVTHNHCKTVVGNYCRKKRGGVGQDAITVLPETILHTKVRYDSGIQLLESKQAFERLLETASEPLQQALDSFLRERYYKPLDPPLIDEFRKLAFTYRVSVRDFQRVLQNV